MDQDDDQYREMRDIWTDYNQRQEFEHDLINRKTTWLLTGESILFAAYGVSFGRASPDEFRSAVAWAGLLIAAFTLIGVLAIFNSKIMSWRDYRKFFQQTEAPDLPRPLHRRSFAWGVRTINTLITLAPDAFLPIVFIGTWWYLLAQT